MRNLSWLLAGLIALPFPPGASAQAPVAKLNLVIVEGDGAINNIRQRTAREPVVEVQDENHRPVAGALVLFALPTHGASGEFPGGAHTLSVTTDAQGRAVGRGLQPNATRGQYQIQVTASSGGATGSAIVTQTNAIAGAGTAATAGISGKLIAILVVAGAAVAGGVYWATHNGGGGNSNSNPATTVTAGTGTVGAPH
jgi:hypothetical protein